MLKNKEEENTCFICLELKIMKEKKPKRLKNQKIYIKTCQCDGFIHNRCLKTWYTASGKCPICREIMLNKNAVLAVLVSMNENENENINNQIIQQNININNQIIQQNENMGIRMRIYVYIQKNWNKVATYSNILLILFMVNFYLSIFNNFKEDFKQPV